MDAAADTQLLRKVAIKVLPAAVAKDAGRVARLRREAQLLAALDQPGIARVHGLEASNGLTAIVLELVEGEALDDRELYFRNGGRVLSAKVLSTAPAFRAERPRLLFEGRHAREQHNPSIRFYDVAADGRFLMLEPAGVSTASLVLVQNWAEELERLLGR